MPLQDGAFCLMIGWKVWPRVRQPKVLAGRLQMVGLSSGSQHCSTMQNLNFNHSKLLCVIPAAWGMMLINLACQAV